MGDLRPEPTTLEDARLQIIELLKEIKEYRQKYGIMEMENMELSERVYSMGKDLTRMGEIENRDMELLNAKLIEGMTFVVSVDQARKINAKIMFAQKVIELKFSGITGCLREVKSDTEAKKEGRELKLPEAPAYEKKDVRELVTQSDKMVEDSSGKGG